MQSNPTKKPLIEASTGNNQAFLDFWNKLPDDSKQEILKVFWDLAKDIKDSEAAQVLFDQILSIDVIKDTLANRVLTEEDKDTLARKLNLNRKLLDGVNNFLELISIVVSLCPIAIGAIWDLLELGPLDELLVTAATAAAGTLDGPVPVVEAIGALVVLLQIVLSKVPDKVIIAALVSAGLTITGVVFRIFKNLVIYNIIPEPKEAKELEATFKVTEKPTELTESFAAEFRLYETLWD